MTSGKRSKEKRQEDAQPGGVRLAAKITIPQEKLVPIVENMNRLIDFDPSGEKTGTDEIKKQVLDALNSICDEVFQVGVKAGRTLAMEEIKRNQGLVTRPQGLIVPAHVAAARKSQKGGGDDSGT